MYRLPPRQRTQKRRYLLEKMPMRSTCFADNEDRKGLEVSDGAVQSSPEAKLLNTARRLFCQEGIHATGITRIIKEAGVARKTLYNCFSSKDNLLRAVFKAEAQMWLRWFDSYLPAHSKDPGEQIIALFDLLENWFANSEFFGCVFINAVAEHEKGNHWVRGVAIAHRERINACILALARSANCKDAESLTEKIGLIIDGAIVNAMVTADPRMAVVAKDTAQTVLQAHRQM